MSNNTVNTLLVHCILAIVLYIVELYQLSVIGITFKCICVRNCPCSLYCIQEMNRALYLSVIRFRALASCLTLFRVIIFINYYYLLGEKAKNNDLQQQ